jgi:hypothetical protein
MATTANGAPSFRPKSRVDHEVYGLGTVVDVNAGYTTIAFDEAGTKKFMTSMVKLVGSDTPAPAKAARHKKKAAGTD